ncbi:MAG: 1-phosphofructokinase [Erysipelotrichaceae bacterium]
MITTVTLNPAIDRTLTLENLHLGGVNRILSSSEKMGGKGLNVSIVLHALGVETIAVGLIGKKNKDATSDLMKSLEFHKEFQEIPALTRTNTKLIDRQKKQTTDLNEAGFNVKASDMRTFSERLKTWAMRSDYTVLSGSLPAGLPDDTYRKIMQEHMQLSEFMLDADGDALVEGVKAHPFLIKPNLDELNVAFHQNLHTNEEITEYCHMLIETYDIGMILVSLGENGSLLVTHDTAYHASALPIDVVSTVGAGDAMLAGFLAGLSRSLALEECLRMANVCGALRCSANDDALFDYADVIGHIDAIEIRYL